LNDEMFNGTTDILIPFDGVLNWDGVSKSGNKPTKDHVTHFWGSIKRPIARNSIWKCSYVEDIMKGGRWCECCL
jgi:hypothetical protein